MIIILCSTDTTGVPRAFSTLGLPSEYQLTSYANANTFLIMALPLFRLAI